MDLLEATLPPYRHRYAMCVAASKRARWDIDRDVLQSRTLGAEARCLPDAMTGGHELAFLAPSAQALWSQLQARTYVLLGAAADRCMAIHNLQLARGQAFHDDVALEALVRLADEKLKHADLFDRLRRMLQPLLPAGAEPRPEWAAWPPRVLQRSAWAVHGLSLHLQLSAQAHYRASLAPGAALAPPWPDVLLYHWKEEAQHAVLTELAWRRQHEVLPASQRAEAFDDLTALFHQLRGLLLDQAADDATAFLRAQAPSLSSAQQANVHRTLRRAYLCQHIGCGLQEPRFASVLQALLDPDRLRAFQTAVAHAPEELCA